MKKQNVFVENLNMETQTVYHTNGDINIYPCEFELGQQIVSDGNRASQKGRMITEEDGTSYFKRYHKNSGSRYNELYPTKHGGVKESKEMVIFTLRFPKKYGKALIATLAQEEFEEMMAFVRTRKENTEW